MELPRHIFLSAPAFTLGKEFTFTITVSVFIQPFASVPVTTYVVVVAGDAVGLAQLLHDNPVVGDHEYVFAPVAVNVAELPRHIVLSAPAFTVGKALTFTTTVSLFVQLPFEPVTI